MLRIAFSVPYLEPDDLALLSRVLNQIHKPGDSLMDRETCAATLIQLFQSGVCSEEDLIEAMKRRGRA